LRKAVKSAPEKVKMAMEKKSLVGKKNAPATKSNSTKKVDTSKPAASKVVAARVPVSKGGI
jgi:hypothetical protein